MATRYAGYVHDDCTTSEMRRACGCSTAKITVTWEPSSHYAPWMVGLYRVRVAEVGHKYGDSLIVQIFKEPSSSGYTPEELGLSRNEMTSSRAYDVIAERVCRVLLKRHPNMIRYQKLVRDIDEHGVRATLAPRLNPRRKSR